MQKITGTVGENGENKPSNVALVQAILLKTTRAATGFTAAGPYLKSYDGDYGNEAHSALRHFQDDTVFASSDGKQCVPNPRATAGLVKPDDATWEKLIEKVNPDFSDLRVLQQGRTVYAAATAEQLAGKLSGVAGATFNPSFQSKVVTCVTRVHEQFGIAVGVCPKGDRRTFEAQYQLLIGPDHVTNAGPGESNHNFGMAVDLGFERLRWLKKEGQVTENEGWWLGVLSSSQASEAMKFWEALRSVGTSGAVGLFRGPEADRPHLQNWNDANVDMASRLAALLTRSSTMRWRGERQRYSCDLGFGREFYPVGSARQIWNRESTITPEMINRARAAQRPRLGLHPGGPPAAPAVIPGRPPLANNPARAGVPTPNATHADVVAMQQSLRREFESADGNWTAWTPF